MPGFSLGVMQMCFVPRLFSSSYTIYFVGWIKQHAKWCVLDFKVLTRMLYWNTVCRSLPWRGCSFEAKIRQSGKKVVHLTKHEKLREHFWWWQKNYECGFGRCDVGNGMSVVDFSYHVPKKLALSKNDEGAETTQNRTWFDYQGGIQPTPGAFNDFEVHLENQTRLPLLTS